ncbi:cell division protein FtsQ/DivIB [Xylanibacter muris]|uniref:Cell division protein FtsQ n=1 Tax=Xylanibacter muris TaxID=2736290 RepID=A0ABX2AQR1_9BACT|nr:cell division protein FtsQ [Xylanibacter muris]NPD92577.1 cell division protein FtsQ [Xylanibacter muris]
MRLIFNWKRILLTITNIAIAVYLVFAVTAFNKPDDKKAVCSQVRINITDELVDGFLNAEEIKKILKQNKMYPLGKKMTAINTREIETFLRKSPFVDHAVCYKTSSGHIHINLTQRMPVMRVIANNGDNYYVDNHGGIMANDKYTANMIVATGHISKAYAQKVLTKVGKYLVSDKFWQNQTEQVNILSDGSMEIIPRVGNHIIYIGQPTDLKKKLTRMEKFYKYGLNKVGWNKYSYISVEFDNQIICKKNK